MAMPPPATTSSDETTVLVTGGAGFIGSHLCDRLLAEGKRVIAVDDLSGGRIANLAEARGYGPQFSLYNMDVRLDELRTVFERDRPEVVMHLAAQASVSVSMKDPQRDASVNVMGLLNVLEASASAGVRKIVFAASGGTLYGEPRKLPVKETSRRGSRPVSPYGITKKVAEDYLGLYRRDRGLDYTALALANVFGPRQDPHGEAGVVSIFASKMLAGETPTIFGDGEQTRDFVFVDDVVHAFSLAAGEDRASGALVNIGTGIEATVNLVYQVMAKLTGFRGEPRYGPPREGDIRSIALDCGLAGRELGWEPWTTLETGLQAVIDSLRDQ
jgi:UDP-glucose 4-epimerase